MARKARSPDGSSKPSKWRKKVGGEWVWRGVVELPRGADGKRRRQQIYGEKQGDVLDKIKELRRKLAEQRPIDPDKITVEQYLLKWLAKATDKRTPQTQATYETKIRLYIIPNIGSYKLQELKRANIKDMYDAMSKAAVGRRAIRYTHSILHKALADAVDDEKVPRNPADKACSYEYKPRKMEVVPQDKFDQVFNALADRNDWLLPFFYVSLFTGARRGELCALRWSDLHLDGERPYVRIERSTQELRRDRGGIVYGEPKTEASNRTVYLTHGVVELLREHRRAQKRETEERGLEWSPKGLVFTSKSGGPIRPSLVTNHWRLVRGSLGLPDVRLHDLRHSHATMLLAKDVPMKEIQEQLGHQSYLTTANTYLHVTDEMRERTRKALDDLAPEIHLKTPKRTGA